MDNYILDDLKHYMIDHLLYKSGNKVVDDFISYININSVDILEFIPYNRLKDIEFIAEVKVYKGTWIDGNIQSLNKKRLNFKRSGSKTVVLKKLNKLNKV